MSKTTFAVPEPDDQNNVFYLNTMGAGSTASSTLHYSPLTNAYYCAWCNMYHNSSWDCQRSYPTVIYRDNPYPKCEYCDGYHGGTCPRIEKIDYYKDGTIKSIKFRAPESDED